MTRTGRFVFGAHPRRTAVRIVVLGVLSVVIFGWVLIPMRAEGISMLPTYRSGSFHFVNRLAYLGRHPHRGDVVAIRLAGPRVLYVKRIVGLPGERIGIVDGQVQVNGQGLAEPYVRDRRSWNVPDVTLAPGEYFVIGDNRGMREGDHDFGRVDRARILGRVLF